MRVIHRIVPREFWGQSFKKTLSSPHWKDRSTLSDINIGSYDTRREVRDLCSRLKARQFFMDLCSDFSEEVDARVSIPVETRLFIAADLQTWAPEFGGPLEF